MLTVLEFSLISAITCEVYDPEQIASFHPHYHLKLITQEEPPQRIGSLFTSLVHVRDCEIMGERENCLFSSRSAPSGSRGNSRTFTAPLRNVKTSKAFHNKRKRAGKFPSERSDLLNKHKERKEGSVKNCALSAFICMKTRSSS
jgi:hypothetical protein